MSEIRSAFGAGNHRVVSARIFRRLGPTWTPVETADIRDDSANRSAARRAGEGGSSEQ